MRLTSVPSRKTTDARPETTATSSSPSGWKLRPRAAPVPSCAAGRSRARRCGAARPGPRGTSRIPPSRYTPTVVCAASNGSPSVEKVPAPFRRSRDPVLAHQLARPLGLAHRPARQELRHHRLDVDHRRALDRVEALHLERAPLAAARSSRSSSRAGSAGPSRAARRCRPSATPGCRADGARRGSPSRVDAVEAEDHLGVRERLEARRGTPGSRSRVELDRRAHVAPVVVAEVVARALHVADRPVETVIIAEALRGAYRSPAPLGRDLESTIAAFGQKSPGTFLNTRTGTRPRSVAACGSAGRRRAPCRRASPAR